MGDFFGKRGIINYFMLFYGVGFIVYYLIVGKTLGKSAIFWIAISKLLRKMHPKNFNKEMISKQEKLAILVVLVKVIYIPLMLLWFFTNSANLITSFENLITLGMRGDYDFNKFYITFLHPLFLNLIFWVDVSIFLVGYSIEFNVLKNKIKSVEPTLLGWVAALMCYPMFSTLTSYFLSRYSENTPDFIKYFGSSETTLFITTLFGMLCVVFFAIYGWASVALGFKGSNLTNRGIVSHGPYAIIRHPAYMSKNIARILGASPLIVYSLYKGNFSITLVVCLSLIAWVMVYHLRALTEERHLLADPDYVKYCEKVKYMYIPGVF